MGDLFGKQTWGVIEALQKLLQQGERTLKAVENYYIERDRNVKAVYVNDLKRDVL